VLSVTCPGLPAAKVLLGGKSEDSLEAVEAALVTHLLGGAGIVSHVHSLNGWRHYIKGLMTGLILHDTSGEAKKGKATQSALEAYLTTLQGLVLHSIFDRLSAYLALSGRTLNEVLMDLTRKSKASKNHYPQEDEYADDDRDNGMLKQATGQSKAFISHEALRTLLATFRVPLHREEVVTLIAKYDIANDGFLSVDDLIQDSRRFAAADEVWSSLSDALGAGGGAQLLLPANASFASNNAARLFGEEKERKQASKAAITGSRLPLTVLKSSLFKCCGIHVEQEDWININPELDPLQSGVTTIERFMMLISAYRTRCINRAWIQLLPKWKGKSISDILQGLNAVSMSTNGLYMLPNKSGEVSLLMISEGLSLNFFNRNVSKELIQSLNLVLDPYETGHIKIPYLELIITLKINEMKEENNVKKSQDGHGHGLESNDRDLKDFTLALESYNVRWRRELTELSAQLKRTSAEELYYSDVSELNAINSAALSCLTNLKTEASHEAIEKGGYSLVRGKKAQALLGSRHLRLNLLLILELQRDLTNVYLNARGFRLHGSDIPVEEEKKRVKILNRLRAYKSDILLMAQVGGEGGEVKEDINIIKGTPEAQVVAATSVWKTRAADRLWSDFADQLRITTSSQNALLLGNMLSSTTSGDGHADGGDGGGGAYEMMLKQFQKMDDGSGEVTYWEFFEGLRRLGAKMDETESDIMIQALDASGSGKIKLEIMMKHFAYVLQETSANPPAARALSMVASSVGDAMTASMTSTAKFVVEVLGSTDTPQLEPSEQARLAMMSTFLGQDPELGHTTTSFKALPPPIPTSYEEVVANQNEDIPTTNKLLPAGTAVLAVHKETGDRFRAVVLEDHGDGFVRVQFSLAILGADDRVSKKDIMTLKRATELERIWHEVSRSVGAEGMSEVLDVASDAAGKISHGGLMAWLHSKGMGTLDIADKHILLADLDPLCHGVINVSRFKSKLAKFRAKTTALGISLEDKFNRHSNRQDNNKLSSQASQAGIDSDEEEFEVSAKMGKKKKVSTLDNTSDNIGEAEEVEEEHFELMPSTGGDSEDVRMEQLEAMMLDMARREQELTKALIESQAKAASLNQEIDHMGRVAKT